MPKCPECKGKMEYDPPLRKYVCQVCGLALTKSEIEDEWDEIRYIESNEDRRERELQEYKDWYFKRGN
ncbi:MAG: hypothetical protein JW776_10535 [Candidatus Lokiarchaeota archaeon]|nr:hypothetical protein [Candidatus Lokiarchaeota archaeon]